MTDLTPLQIELLIEALVLKYAKVIEDDEPDRKTAYFQLIKKLMDHVK